MDKNLLVLLPAQQERRSLRQLQRKHFLATGDASFYRLPPVVILGRTSSRGVDRRSVHQELAFSPLARKTSLGYLFQADLDTLQQQFHVSGEAGLFFTQDKDPGTLQLPSLKDFRLALLEWHPEGYLLLQ